MKTVECKIAHEEASKGCKVAFGGHEGTFFASRNYPQSGGTAPWGMNTWSWLIFILSIGIKRLNFSSKVLRYCNEAVLPFYTLHQTVILVIGFFVVKWNLNMALKYPIIATGSMIVILAIYIC